MVTHANVLAVLDNTRELPGGGVARQDDSIVIVLPLFHAYALNLVLNRTFLAGARGLLVHRFDAERIMALIEEHRATVFYGAPPMYFALVNTAGLDHYDLSSLRLAYSGAAPLPLVILERFKERTGVEICEGYGLSETAPTLCSNACAPKNKPGTVGPPIPGVELRIVDDEGRDVPRGEVGEIIARGPNIFKGYWRRQEDTAEAFRGGWFHTGDLGRVDEDGYYVIVDRKKDMVLVSGYNVYPVEIENVLLRHPKVIDAAVFGVPSDYQGESVKAVVVLRPGAAASEDDIKAFCRERLASFKVPRFVEFQASLPRNPAGKLLKRELRAQSEPAPAAGSPTPG
jgi:long-chain acyl-CoA synthetase